MNDDPRQLDKPDWFTVDAYVYVSYRSPRSTRRDTKSIGGFIVEDDGDELVIEEYNRNVPKARVNEHRTIRVDLGTLDTFSQTDNRTTLLGQVDTIELVTPPWDDSDLAGGYAYHARFNNQIVREGVWEFPDPDYMNRPDGWEP